MASRLRPADIVFGYVLSVAVFPTFGIGPLHIPASGMTVPLQAARNLLFRRSFFLPPADVKRFRVSISGISAVAPLRHNLRFYSLCPDPLEAVDDTIGTPGLSLGSLLPCSPPHGAPDRACLFPNSFRSFAPWVRGFPLRAAPVPDFFGSPYAFFPSPFLRMAALLLFSRSVLRRSFPASSCARISCFQPASRST